MNGIDFIDHLTYQRVLNNVLVGIYAQVFLSKKKKEVTSILS